MHDQVSSEELDQMLMKLKDPTQVVRVLGEWDKQGRKFQSFKQLLDAFDSLTVSLLAEESQSASSTSETTSELSPPPPAAAEPIAGVVSSDETLSAVVEEG